MRIDNPQLSGSIFATGSTFLTGSVTINDYSLPSADGIDRQILKTDGLGNITFGYPEDITVTVKNISGTTLQKGTPVHVTGSTGNTSEVIAASASVADTMPATFILNETLADEAEGEALIAGFIQGVNTDGFIPGAVVYVGPNGGYVQTRPTGSNLIQNLGIITKAHPTNGSGVVLGAGRSNDVPNITPGNIWVGNTSHRAIPVPTSSLSVAFATSASYAVSASHEITYEKSSSYADFALTASFALNAGGGAGAGFPFSGSADITGSLYVSGGNISGSFVGDGAGLTGLTINEFATFEDTFTNATSHSAVHNFNTKNVFVQVFEDDDTLLIPNSVTTTDVNTVDIVFGDTLSGRVVIGKAGHLLQDTGNFASSSTAVQTFTNATTASINHGLNSENVITQVFDLNGNVIVPSNIKVANSNTVQLTFASVRSGKAVVAKAGHIVQGTSENAVSASFSDVSKRVRAGSSGSRPTDYVNIETGSLWYNTDTSILEVYSGVSGSEWRSVTYVEPTPYGVDFLVVAGGGGGGGSTAGGGGAGGLRTSYGSNSGGGASSETALTLTPGTQYTVTIGAGGTGGRTANSGTPDGTNGEDSSITGTGITTVTSLGGGYGASGRGDGVTGSRVANSGGSGGGGGYYSGNDADITAGGSGTSGQGYKGGDSSANADYGGAGGGGASAAAADVDNGGNGGAGLAVSITGTSVTYAGGGGGGGHDTAGAGGAGGGGAGNISSNATAGTANTGGGGGGVGTYQTGNGGAGGSGVVVLRMLTSDYTGTTSGSPTVTGDGTYTILTYTQSGTYTA